MFYGLSDGSFYGYDGITETLLLKPGSGIEKIHMFRMHNNKLYFTASKTSMYLYVCDLVSNTTTELTMLDTHSFSDPIFIIDDKAVARGETDNSKYLINAITSDGTVEGTIPLLSKKGSVYYKADDIWIDETNRSIYFSSPYSGLYVLKLNTTTSVADKTSFFAAQIYPNPSIKQSLSNQKHLYYL